MRAVSSRKCLHLRSTMFTHIAPVSHSTLYNRLTYLYCNTCFHGKQTAFLEIKNNNFELPCEGKLIIFLSYFKIEAI